MVTLTHPANWGPYKCELFAQVPELAGLGEVQMLTEPEAAAAHYARNDRLDPGALVAVYDLGGGTFDATVLRTTEHGFDILGRPEGIEGLGGIDFDEAVFTHVDQTLDGAVSRLDPADPRATSAAIRLRHECVTAKETLSADTETTIPVLLPELQTEVRLTRGEFEKMIRPAIGATIASLRRALQSARIDPAQLHTVLLVGGSSRIPMVAHLVSAELGRPTSVDTHPKHAIALGAAAVGADTTRVGAAATAAPALGRLTPPPADKAGLAEASALVPPLVAGAAAPALAAPSGDRLGRLRWWRGRSASSLAHDGDGHPGQPSDDQSPTHPRRRRLPLVIGVLVLVAALAGGGTAASRVLSNPTPSNPTPTTSHQPPPPASHGSGTTTGGGSGGTGNTGGRSGGGSGPTIGGGSGGTGGRSGGGSGTTTGARVRATHNHAAHDHHRAAHDHTAHDHTAHDHAAHDHDHDHDHTTHDHTTHDHDHTAHGNIRTGLGKDFGRSVDLTVFPALIAEPGVQRKRCSDERVRK